VPGSAPTFLGPQTLREDGFAGRLVLTTREDRLPYDRPNLSKEYLQGKAKPEWLPLRSDDFFAEHDIEVVRDKEIERVDAAKKTVNFADGGSLLCDAVLVATGGEPRALPFQSEAQENCFLLRSYADANALVAAAEKGKRAVVIGAGFIGMEVASSLRARGCEVTVVAPDDVPFKKTLGAKIGKVFQDVHEEHSVRFKLGASVACFTGTKVVTAVILKNGERLDADLVVVGVGVKPATDFLKGVTLHKDGGVIVDEHMRVPPVSSFQTLKVICFGGSCLGNLERIDLRLHDFREARGTNTMAEFSLRMSGDVTFDILPIILVVTDLFAVAADRNNSLQFLYPLQGLLELAHAVS
jgi:NADPH-dependent 2,4-dienoyl-CoA reductase/sulfur reductase-like enzyme